MKTSKRILAAIISVMLVLTTITVPTFAAFTDLAEGSDAYDAANILNMLGVINGYPDGSFKPENNVTRAEFTAMLLRTRGMGSIGSTSLENPPFPDVTTSDVSWAIANIRTAHQMGVINGYDDGTFKPNNNVSYEEAVKMIVCALGYGEMGTEGTYWYSKYLVTATSLGFTKGVGGAIGAPATRAVIAKMLYNCLELKIAENNQMTNKTVLENDLKLVKNVGYIASNPTISLFAPKSTLRDNEIQIAIEDTNEVVTYKVENAEKYNDMLGAQIVYYYTTDTDSGFKTIISATVSNTEVLEIEASQLDRCTDSSIDYYATENASRTISVGIDTNSVVVYNGKLFGTTASDSTFADYCNYHSLPTIGKIKLLDRDGDKNFDVLFIDSYESWIVSAATSSNETVTDDVLRTTNQQLVIKDSNDLSIVNENGDTLSFSSIKKGNVLSVKKDNHGGTTVVVSTDIVSGKITAANSTTGVTIDGKTYKFSKQAPWGFNPIDSAVVMAQPQYGDRGKFYLDIEGNILAYDKTEAVTTQYYGYIINARLKNDAFEDTLRLNISTKASPTGTLYNVSSKTKINGTVPATLADAKTILDGAASKAVKFTLSGLDIDEIITATPSSTGNDIEADTLYLYDVINTSTDMTYDKSSKELNGGGASIYIGNAQIVSIENNKFKNMSLSDFISDSSVKYKVEILDVTTTDSAKYVVVHSGGAAVGAVKATSPVMVITEANKTTTDDGEKRWVISGYVGKEQKNELALSITDSETISNAPSLKEGDVVRLGTDSDGYYTIADDHIIFRADAGYRATAITQPEINVTGTGSTPSNLYPKEEYDEDTLRYKVIWGSAYQYDGERLIVSNDLLETDTTSSNTTAIAKSAFSNAKVFRYDATDAEEPLSVEDGEDILASLVCTGQNSRPSEIFIHMTYNNTVATMIIVER